MTREKKFKTNPVAKKIKAENEEAIQNAKEVKKYPKVKDEEMSYLGVLLVGMLIGVVLAMIVLTDLIVRVM